MYTVRFAYLILFSIIFAAAALAGETERDQYETIALDSFSGIISNTSGWDGRDIVITAAFPETPLSRDTVSPYLARRRPVASYAAFPIGPQAFFVLSRPKWKQLQTALQPGQMVKWYGRIDRIKAGKDEDGDREYLYALLVDGVRPAFTIAPLPREETFLDAEYALADQLHQLSRLLAKPGERVGAIGAIHELLPIPEQDATHMGIPASRWRLLILDTAGPLIPVFVSTRTDGDTARLKEARKGTPLAVFGRPAPALVHGQETNILIADGFRFEHPAIQEKVESARLLATRQLAADAENLVNQFIRIRFVFRGVRSVEEGQSSSTPPGVHLKTADNDLDTDGDKPIAIVLPPPVWEPIQGGVAPGDTLELTGQLRLTQRGFLYLQVRVAEAFPLRGGLDRGPF